MRSKTSLFLVELTLMILFFAVSAAICLQVFAAAQLKSRAAYDLTNASFYASSAAEIYKATGDVSLVAKQMGGSFIEGDAWVCYDRDWRIVDSDFAFVLLLRGEIAAEKHAAIHIISMSENLETNWEYGVLEGMEKEVAGKATILWIPVKAVDYDAR